MWMENKLGKQVKLIGLNMIISFYLFTLGNASPLGLLFDHGCDALIVFI
jgi:hypothetical protein